jgi:hypothetical protein
MRNSFAFAAFMVLSFAVMPTVAPAQTFEKKNSNARFWTFLHSLYARARETEWELGTFATDKYRSSLTTSRNHYAARGNRARSPLRTAGWQSASGTSPGSDG